MINKKLTLILDYRCNNNCRFCYSGDKKNLGLLSTIQAKYEIERGLRRGCNIIDFMGGEPTLRNDLAELIEFAKNSGYKTVSITTNGRLLSYRKFAKKLIDSGLNSFIFSIHGSSAKTHDFLTRVNGSYRQLINGMKNVKELNPTIYICTNTTINKYNYKYLPEIVENNIRLGADACEMIFVHPRGNALKNFDEIVPTLTELEPYIKKTLCVAERLGISYFVFRYFPICYIVDFKDNLSEYVTRFSFREQHIGPEFSDLNVEEGRKKSGRVKGEICKKCKYYDDCEGIFNEYAERFGFGELKPVNRGILHEQEN